MLHGKSTKNGLSDTDYSITRLIGWHLPYISTSGMRSLLQDHQKPLDAIHRLVNKGVLIPLRKGLYLIAHHESVRSGGIPYFAIANLMNGPSYVSLQSALSYYQLIPEAVFTTTSVTLKRNVAFDTPIGSFTFVHLHDRLFPLGVQTLEVHGYPCRIASPEKALCDLLSRLPPLRDLECLERELLESLRIEPEDLHRLEPSQLAFLASAYHHRNPSLLAQYCAKCA